MISLIFEANTTDIVFTHRRHITLGNPREICDPRQEICLIYFDGGSFLSGLFSPGAGCSLGLSDGDATTLRCIVTRHVRSSVSTYVYYGWRSQPTWSLSYSPRSFAITINLTHYIRSTEHVIQLHMYLILRLST